MKTTRKVSVPFIRRLLLLAMLLGAQFAASGAQAAAVPELPGAGTASGAPTTAKFFAGVTADGGNTYGSSFSPTQLLDINAEFRPESGHVGNTGNLFVVVANNGQFFMRGSDGNFLPWNGNTAQLQPTVTNKLLQSVETLKVVSGIAFGAAGLAGQSFQVYLAYNRNANPGQLYFSGTPASFAISTGVDANQAALDYFTTNVSTQIVAGAGLTCIFCHVANGQAANTPLVYTPLSQANAVQNNFNVLKNYVLTQANGGQLILTKPQGQNHLGGVLLPPGSSTLTIWTQFVELVKAIGGGQASQVSALMSSQLLDSEDTLRKAALLFAGRLPTASELQQVASGGDTALRSAVRALMTGNSFKAFLTEGANDRLLTLKYETGGAFQVLNRYYYPLVDALLNATGTAARNERTLISRAIAREPLELIAHVVMNERPYTEILTANYIMLNPYSAKAYGGNLQFSNPNDFNEWRQGTITEYYRCTVCAGPNANSSYNIPTVYPHAGLLNSPMFLARFPSTETNRNRARARWAYYFFLGVDIEALAPRTTDPAALADEDNPTLNNSNCTVCHNVMDPVAGAFQNYGDDGQYKNQPGGNDALPRSYKRSSLYRQSDRWFADMLKPGFGTQLAPSPDESLQWLGQQFAADPRFGYGAVNFWLPAVIGKQAQKEPENPEDADYFSRLLSYTAEQAMMNEVAQAFLDGTHGNGRFNLKDLLVDLVMSEHFRAVSASGLSAGQKLELEDVGIGKLLTPEQLNRKLQTTTGFNWTYGNLSALDETYRLIYGGIDSDGITKRATDLTTLMSAVVTTMANETSCSIVAQDFGRPRQSRFLFTDVELNYLPSNQSTAIKQNIQRLHSRLLGEDLALNDPEIQATYDLFNTVWQARVAAGKGAAVSTAGEFCSTAGTTGAITQDSNQTLRSWAVVINYLLRDYRFIYE